MFTGLIEEVGTIAGIVERGGNHRITINAPNTAKELHTGNSVAVSGVCLTALDITPHVFLRRSRRRNLGAHFPFAHHPGRTNQS